MLYSGGDNNIIEFITIATTGNGTDFGDLQASSETAAGGASLTRYVSAGGQQSTVTIEYVEIATTGNASDFGDLTNNSSGDCGGGASNAHGGLA